MADILIRGMEMPKDGRITIQIGADGAVYFVEKCTIMAEKYEKSSHAVPLPEGHGRLIDAGVFRDQLIELAMAGKDAASIWLILFVEEMLNNAPTIVPAEGGSE